MNAKLLRSALNLSGPALVYLVNPHTRAKISDGLKTASYNVCSSVHARGFLSGRQRRNLVP